MKTGHSIILNQDYIVNDSGMLLTIEDLTVYTPEEMRIIKGSSHDLMRGLHLMKKHFESEVIK